MAYKKTKAGMNLTSLFLLAALIAFAAVPAYNNWRDGEIQEAAEEKRKLDTVDKLAEKVFELQLEQAVAPPPPSQETIDALKAKVSELETEQSTLGAIQQGTIDVILEQGDALRSLSIEVTK